MKAILTAASFLALAAALPASAQQVQVEEVNVRSLSYEVQNTPQFEAGNVKSKNVPNPKSWLEIEVEFEAKANQRNAVIPELLFRYYVAIQSRDGNTQVLTGDVTHVNVVSGERYFSAVYVSPMTLGTITGDFRRFQSSAVRAVAVEIIHNGVTRGGRTEGSGSGRWWEAVPNIQQGAVLPKEKTPFALLWTDRYADTKP